MIVGTLQPVRASHDGAVVLPFFANVPTGHTTIVQPNEAHWPVICAGEWALVDTNDRTLVEGQLYAIQQSRGPRLWRIPLCDPKTTPLTDEPSWFLHPLRRQNIDEELRRSGEERRLNPGRIPVLNIFMSDGPIYEWALIKQLIGRVVGIYDAGRASSVA